MCDVLVCVLAVPGFPLVWLRARAWGGCLGSGLVCGGTDALCWGCATSSGRRGPIWQGAGGRKGDHDMWTTVGTDQVLSVNGLVVKVSTDKPEGGRYSWSVLVETGAGKARKQQVVASGMSRRLAAARERALLALIAALTAQPAAAPTEA